MADGLQVGVCIGASITLLTIYCSVQARAHTTHALQSTSGGPSPGAQVAGYNSSAATVSALWLFANIYFVNWYVKLLILLSIIAYKVISLRASRAQLQFPAIVYSIFVTGTTLCDNHCKFLNPDS